MQAIALAEPTQQLWLTALVVGAVVLVVVIVLLTILLRRVREIDEGVRAIYEHAGPLAANTATAAQLERTTTVVDRLVDEATRHDQLLDRKS